MTIEFILSVQTQPTERTPISTIQLKIIDNIKFQHDLKQKLDNMADIDDLVEIYHRFISAMESTINSHAPLKQKTIS